MIKILWGNKKKIWFQLYARACAHMNAYAPGTEMRFSKRHRGNAYSAKITRIESWAILLRKILSCKLNSLKGVVCVSRSAFVWGDNNAGIFYKTSKALSTLILMALRWLFMTRAGDWGVPKLLSKMGVSYVRDAGWQKSPWGLRDCGKICVGMKGL